MNVDLRNDGRGTIHVHAVGCADLNKAKFRHMESQWTQEAASAKDVVIDVYPPDHFDYEPKDWEEFAGDIHFYPCVTF